MKGIHKRYLDRTARRTSDRSMDIYEQTLDQIVRASGDGKTYRQDQQDLNKTIAVGEVVAVRCEDAPDYYRSVVVRGAVPSLLLVKEISEGLLLPLDKAFSFLCFQWAQLPTQGIPMNCLVLRFSCPRSLPIEHVLFPKHRSYLGSCWWRTSPQSSQQITRGPELGDLLCLTQVHQRR